MTSPPFRFDPRTEEDVPKWFWEIIESGQQQRPRFKRICQELDVAQLREFIQRLEELANFFTAEHFLPPDHLTFTDRSLEDVGVWVISQGEEFFLSVWDDRKKFWELVEQDVEEVQAEKSYLYVGEDVWMDRVPDEEIPRF